MIKKKITPPFSLQICHCSLKNLTNTAIKLYRLEVNTLRNYTIKLKYYTCTAKQSWLHSNSFKMRKQIQHLLCIHTYLLSKFKRSCSYQRERWENRLGWESQSFPVKLQICLLITHTKHTPHWWYLHESPHFKDVPIII